MENTCIHRFKQGIPSVPPIRVEKRKSKQGQEKEVKEGICARVNEGSGEGGERREKALTAPLALMEAARPGSTSKVSVWCAGNGIGARQGKEGP